MRRCVHTIHRGGLIAETLVCDRRSFARVLPRCCPDSSRCQEGKNRAEILNRNQRVIGAPEEIRTPDPQIRSLVLYPAELRALAASKTEGPRTGARVPGR